MKILANPEWIDIVRKLTKKDHSEILVAMLSYPNDKCDNPVWRFMRKQIDRDAQKYQKKCETLSENRQNRWTDKQTGGRNATDNEQIAPDSVGKESNSIESEKQIKKENGMETKFAVDRLVRGVARNFDANAAPARYEITDDLEFYLLLKIQ